MNDNWKRLKSTLAYENDWIAVYHEDVIAPTGNQGIYGRIHYKNRAIGIVPIDNDGNTWLVGQHRYPFDEYTWEIPEGGGKLSNDSLESAQRELAEEVGLKAKKWQLIQEAQLSNSASDEISLLYIAQDLSITECAPDETEVLRIKKIKLVEAIEMVINGTITDSLSVMALLKTKILLDSGDLKI